MFKAIYDTEAEIPAEVKKFYTTRADGKWVFNHAQFDGLPALTNPTLEANRNDWQHQAMEARRTLTETQARVTTLEAQAGLKNAPGSMILSEADAKVWNQLNGLGKADEVIRRFSAYPELEAKTRQAEEIAALETLAQQTGLNFSTLKSELPLRGKGIKLSQKPITVTENGREVVKQVAYATIKTKTATGETNVSEEPFLEYVKKAGWPDYVVGALTAQQQNGNQQQQANGHQPVVRPLVPNTGVSNPNGQMGGQQTSNGVVIDNAALVQRFNAGRGVKPAETANAGAAA